MIRALMAVLVFLAGAGSAHAVVIFYNDQSAFDAATAGLTFTVDPFDNDIPDAISITFDSSVISERMGGIPFPGHNSVTGGRYFNAVDGDGTMGPITITWTFPAAITAVGFDYFGLRPDEVNITVDGETRALRESSDGDPEDGFFGFTTTNPVTSVVFSTFHPAFDDSFSLDDLQFTSGALTSAVPAPATLPMLIAALGGIGILARRRRACRPAPA